MPDLSKIRKEFIPANQVPSKTYALSSQWDEILKMIPQGQALVLREPEVSAGSVRAVLRARHAHGKFKNIQMSTRGARRKATIYLVNTDKSVTPTRKAKPQEGGQIGEA